MHFHLCNIYRAKSRSYSIRFRRLYSELPPQRIHHVCTQLEVHSRRQHVVVVVVFVIVSAVALECVVFHRSFYLAFLI